MMNKKILVAALIGTLIISMVSLGLSRASASDGTPEGVTTFQITTGQTCVIWPDGSGECYCECEEGCHDVPTSEYNTPTGEPTQEGSPTDTAVPEPTSTEAPTLTSTPEPTAVPTEREGCNRGLGNGSEECDPGNSGGKPGNAGEGNE